MSGIRIQPTLLMGGAVLLGALILYLVTPDNGLTPRELQVGDLIFVGGKLFQEDHAHPVWGWYPTSRWLPGEVVRDDYLIPDSPAYDGLMVLAYWRTDGVENLGAATFPLE